MHSAVYKTHHNIKFSNPVSTSKHTVPLLHIEEIDDFRKIYEVKKKELKSASQKPPSKYWTSEEEKEVKIELSAEQKIEKYKKMQYEEKLNRKKRGNLSENKFRANVYPTPLRKFLKRMSNYSMTEKESSYLNEIKQSEKELHFVKCNPTRKRRIVSGGGPSSQQFHRTRILSLKDGLPMDLGNLYPTLEEKIDELKPPPPAPKPSLLESVEKSIENFFY